MVIDLVKGAAAWTLRLGGTADVFEVAALHRAAREVVADGPGPVVVDVREVEAIDTPITQVLVALRETLARTRHTVRFEGVTPAIAENWRRLGFEPPCSPDDRVRGAAELSGRRGDDVDTISRQVVEDAARDVLQTSASAEVLGATHPEGQSENVSGLIAMLSLTGPRGGTLVVSCDKAVAGRLAAGMLGTHGQEVDEDTVRDALGELVNQIGGTIKRRLVAAGADIMLSVPVVVAGSPISHRVKSKARPLAVDLQMKDGPLHVGVWLV
jgi:chemotaxis protein CheX